MKKTEFSALVVKTLVCTAFSVQIEDFGLRIAFILAYAFCLAMVEVFQEVREPA